MGEKLLIDQETFVGSINGTYCQTKSDALKEIARSLMFPEHFGGNLDALEDCLTDLSWIEKEKVILVINNQNYFLKNEQADLKELFFKIFEDVEKEWRANGTESKTFSVIK